MIRNNFVFFLKKRKLKKYFAWYPLALKNSTFVFRIYFGFFLLYLHRLPVVRQNKKIFISISCVMSILLNFFFLHHFRVLIFWWFFFDVVFPELLLSILIRFNSNYCLFNDNILFQLFFPIYLLNNSK